ncbi:MAG: hypothetical protein PUF11_09385 [Parafannyhessea umbonata]|uniref:hypothetical protein n=1 Tax=Parafannyhessea umbonata TaxID=604330 RepID=UPI0026EBB98E|nr:hypothetical protein [Parafannyhessea umbonata]MDD6566977.1 hypothetical protein [Parafannyhessea umbonata]
MRITNEQAGNMINALAPLLGRTDSLGYAAAYNTRTLTNEAMEYIQLYQRKLEEYGTPVVDEDGNQTGQYELEVASQNFERFRDETRDFALMEHDFEPYTVPVTDAMGRISGSQMLSVQWMFVWGDTKGGDA